MRKYPIVSIIALFLLGAFAYALPPVHAQAVTVAIQPNDVRGIAAGGNFHVDLVASNVPADIAGTRFGLFGFQALVTFDPAVLTVPAGGATFSGEWLAQIAAGCAFGSVTIAPTGDAVNAFITLFNIPGVCAPGLSGTVGLIGINFNVDANMVSTVINIDEPGTILSDVNGTLVAYVSDDGFFSNVPEQNFAPVLTVPGPQTLAEGTMNYMFTVTADDTTDTVSDTVTITASGVPSFASCPTTSGTNTATLTCTLNPGELDDGVYTIGFSASDGVNPAVTGSVQVTVNEVNNFAPVITAPSSVSLLETEMTDVPASASDADVILGVGAPVSLIPSFTVPMYATPFITCTSGSGAGSTSASCHVMPTETDDGSFTITWTSGTVTAITAGTVTEVNVAPSINAGADETPFNEGQTLTHPVTATDADFVMGSPQTLTYSLSGDCQTAGATIDPTTGTVTWVTDSTDGRGQFYTCTVTVSDGALTASDSFLVTVNDVAEPLPTLVVPADFSADELTLVSFTVTASDSNAAQTVTLSAMGIPSWLTCTPPLPAAGNPVSTQCSGTPSELQDGVYTIAFTATDNLGGTASDSLVITIREVNVAPSIDAGADEAINEGNTLTHPVTASDPDRINPGQMPQTLTFTLSGTCQTQGATIDMNTGTVSWATDEMDDGVWTCTVTVSDGVATSSDSFQVTVGEVNVPPSLNVPLDFSTPTGQTITFTVTATDVDVVGGVAQQVTLDATGIPAGMTCSPSLPATGNPVSTTCTWTPSTAGTFTITFSANDGVAPAVEDSLTITVTERFDYRLSVNPTDGGNVKQGASTSTTVTATLVSGSPTSVTITASSSNPGVSCLPSPNSVTPTASYTLTCTVASNAALGPVTVTLTGTADDVPNDDGETATYTFDVVGGNPHARLFRGKLSWTHHLNLDKQSLQVFTAKVQNDGNTPVFAFVSVQILLDTGEVARLESPVIYLTPGTFNLDVVITWDPPNTRGTIKYTLNATVYYMDATGMDPTPLPATGAYPYPGWTPDPASSKGGAFATVCDIACPL